jgi:class 3 adenylate cyclase
VQRKKRLRKSLPSGTITAMFTDIANSTKLKGLMEGETAARRDANFRSNVKEPHDHIILPCVEEAGGLKVKSTGDGYYFTFTDAEEAVLCAIQIQERLCIHPINTPLGPLQVRIGLHTGIASPTGDDYIASTIDKAARVQSKAEAGQVFISRETHALVIRMLRGAAFEQMGTFELKGLEPEDIYRVLRADVHVAIPIGDLESQQGAPAPAELPAEDSRKPVPTPVDRGEHLAEFQNPFEFDMTATRKTFKGRQVELEELLDSIETGTHTAVFGLQRMGKTSLMEEGLREGLKRRAGISEAVLPVKIDMQRLGGAQVK